MMTKANINAVANFSPAGTGMRKAVQGGFGCVSLAIIAFGTIVLGFGPIDVPFQPWSVLDDSMTFMWLQRTLGFAAMLAAVLFGAVAVSLALFATMSVLPGHSRTMVEEGDSAFRATEASHVGISDRAVDDAAPVRITVYRWAGKWGPFKVTIPCGECALTADIIRDTLDLELYGVPVEVETHDWLSNWWKPLLKGGWHAPIVMVDGEVVSQGAALNRGVLTEAVVAAHVRRVPLKGTHIFGKVSCPHCMRAKTYMRSAGIQFAYHDIIKEPRSLYAMLARVKPLVGPKTPITVPQVWVDGEYIGGADQLAQFLRIES